MVRRIRGLTERTLEAATQAQRARPSGGCGARTQQAHGADSNTIFNIMMARAEVRRQECVTVCVAWRIFEPPRGPGAHGCKPGLQQGGQHCTLAAWWCFSNAHQAYFLKVNTRPLPARAGVCMFDVLAANAARRAVSSSLKQQKFLVVGRLTRTRRLLISTSPKLRSLLRHHCTARA